MASSRGRNRNSGAVSDRRSDDSKGSPESSKPQQPEVPLSYEYETEDGLMVEITPTSASVSREYQLSESDYLEFEAGIEWNIIDVDIDQRGNNTAISGEIGLPGDVLGLGGGVEIDLATGEITGGEISGEIGTVGVEVSVSNNGCSVSVGVSILGMGATYSRDVCNDEDEDEDDDRESRPPRSDDEWSGPEAEGEIGDIQRRLRDRGICSGVVHFDHYDYWQIGVEAFDPFYMLDLGSGLFFHEFLDPRYPDITWEEHEVNLDWLFNVSLLYKNHNGQGRLVLDPSEENQQNFDRCMAKIYPDRKPPKKPPPPGKPPMRERDCCAASTKMIREIHKALNAREILDNNLIVPNRLVAPNAKGAAKLKSYLDIAQWQMRMMDHLGLHPFKSSLSDANAAQAGNQKVEIQFASGTAALNKIVELLLENKGDSATRLNLQVRSAVAIAQILKVATITSKTASAIASFIGMPLKEKISKIKMPFDITLGKRRSVKGFDPTQQKEQAIEAIKMNEEASTEEILPEFLQTSEQPYVHETYDGNFPSLIQQLRGQGRNGSEKT